MPEWDIQRQSVLGRSGSDLCYSTGDYYVSVVYLDSVSLNEAVDSINQVLKEK
jgi:hypothetical protein